MQGGRLLQSSWAFQQESPNPGIGRRRRIKDEGYSSISNSTSMSSSANASTCSSFPVAAASREVTDQSLYLRSDSLIQRGILQSHFGALDEDSRSGIQFHSPWRWVSPGLGQLCPTVSDFAGAESLAVGLELFAHLLAAFPFHNRDIENAVDIEPEIDGDIGETVCADLVSDSSTVKSPKSVLLEATSFSP